MKRAFITTIIGLGLAIGLVSPPALRADDKKTDDKKDTKKKPAKKKTPKKATEKKS